MRNGNQPFCEQQISHGRLQVHRLVELSQIVDWRQMAIISLKMGNITLKIVFAFVLRMVMITYSENAVSQKIVKPLKKPGCEAFFNGC